MTKHLANQLLYRNSHKSNQIKSNQINVQPIIAIFSYLSKVLVKCCCVVKTTKGLAKLRNIVAETLLRMQMFPSLAARETCVAETNFAARKQKMFLPWSQKQFCFPDTNFASETYVSQFSQPGEHNKKHCFRKNAS